MQVLQQWAKKGWPKHIMGNVAKIINGSDYSNRSWIIQELVLGRQVSFATADRIVPFPELADAGALYDIDTARHDWHAIGTKENPERISGSPLISPLKRYNRHRCREKVDRVFGLLGICSEKVLINYNFSTQSVAIETVV
ncbi:hypothetical protein B0H67DRAFT_147371 [Lasiosphaeris hirsuta]|uniref:Heterokaryon incompatibility domain-containing protein n=1 Tax=Lasiosphaeris hirsuta TaxID=260670 RepID=A0AA40B1Y2_9PEZI|nr:hypothetical protein B0H67DRAFT_147371 [Lasiosphaeris hirsuta]